MAFEDIMAAQERRQDYIIYLSHIYIHTCRKPSLQRGWLISHLSWFGVFFCGGNTNVAVEESDVAGASSDAAPILVA